MRQSCLGVQQRVRVERETAMRGKGENFRVLSVLNEGPTLKFLNCS